METPQPINNFEPFPLLAGGHRQTIAACYFTPKSRVATTVQHRIRLDDGDQLVLHDDCPPDWQPGDATAMLVHGLCGSHRSRYIVRITNKLFARAIRVFRLDLRGSGAGEGLARTFTHCGRASDLEPPIRRIGELTNGSPLAVAGFSLGGALTLTLATSSTKPRHWEQAIAVCPPVDLFAVERLLKKPVHRQYDQFFARKLWSKVIERSQTVPGAPSVDHLTRPRILREFDACYTVPLGGYNNPDDYYEQTSVARHLHLVDIPTLIIAAANDPIVPIEPLYESSLSSTTELMTTDCGGHLGFIGRRGSDPDRYWLDWRVIERVLGSSAESLNCTHNRTMRRLST